MAPAAQMSRWIARGGQIAKVARNGIGRSVSAATGACMIAVGVSRRYPAASSASAKAVSLSSTRNIGC